MQFEDVYLWMQCAFFWQHHAQSSSFPSIRLNGAAWLQSYANGSTQTVNSKIVLVQELSRFDRRGTVIQTISRIVNMLRGIRNEVRVAHAENCLQQQYFYASDLALNVQCISWYEAMISCLIQVLSCEPILVTLFYFRITIFFGSLSVFDLIVYTLFFFLFDGFLDCV
jgi:hypothetical protein